MPQALVRAVAEAPGGAECVVNNYTCERMKVSMMKGGNSTGERVRETLEGWRRSVE